MRIDSLRRVVFTGPESSGKSTLAEQLAAHFAVPLVPEFARAWILGKLARTGGNCVLEDVLAIAYGQQAAEDQAAAGLAGDGFLICDTDVLTIRIWSECFFGAVPSELDAMLAELSSKTPAGSLSVDRHRRALGGGWRARPVRGSLRPDGAVPRTVGGGGLSCRTRLGRPGDAPAPCDRRDRALAR
ncbi:MAG: ATP-binding protein [Chromatiales bacterium]|nr:ATP-binding protein [Chromatiales bacterium]